MAGPENAATTRAGRRAETVESLRARILAGALPLMLTNGPSAYSLNRLCAELGIAKKTFYRVFDDYDAFLEASSSMDSEPIWRLWRRCSFVIPPHSRRSAR